MSLSRRVIFLILCGLFIAAVAARVSTTDRLDSPYFKGASAMSYRHMLMVADGVPLTTHDARAGHPEGYVPAQYRAAGAETLAGLAYRAVRTVSDIDGRPFARRLIIVIASLCVFTVYGAASSLWRSREAGLLAAFLVAFVPALVLATNGRVFSHAVFASFFASLYASVALRALPRSSAAATLLAAPVAFLLLWVWEPARYGLAAWTAAAALAAPVERRTRIVFVISHAAAIVTAVLVIPHLAAAHAIGAWTTAAALAVVPVALLPESRRRGWRGPAYLVVATVLLTVLATPLRAGASEQLPALEYAFTRIRFLFERPPAALLSDWMRAVWSSDHAPLTTSALISLMVPVLLCSIAWMTNRAAREYRPRFAAALALFVLACGAVMVDRSLLPIAPVAMIVLVSGGAARVRWRSWPQSGGVLLGAYTALAGVVLAGRPLDITHQVARAAGVTGRDSASFTWVSLENTDRELVRFVSTRTSVSESFLASEDLSGLLLAFTGRTVARLPGATSRAAEVRDVGLTRALYRDETEFYELCRQEKIDYVVYSIDVLLDGGPYSPAYQAGGSTLDPSSIAARMHFDPESLRHFTLMYENDHHRLFRVTASVEPVFLTDHPLFYQRDLFVRDGGSIEKFRSHVVWLMFMYTNGLNARARGDAEEARRIFDQCVRHAPRFTRAQIALAGAYMDLGRYETARDRIAGVIQYAPDNPAALYSAAFVQVQLNHPEAAKPFLELLAQTADAAMIEKGRALQYNIDNRIPLKPGGPPP
jgi:hypothetical protein